MTRTQIFIWYDIPSGSLFIMNFFGSSEAAESHFKAASFGEVYFPWKVFKTAVNPRTVHRLTRRMQFHMELLGKRWKLIKCFVMQGYHRQKNFPYITFVVQMLFKLSSSASKHVEVQIHANLKFNKNFSFSQQHNPIKELCCKFIALRVPQKSQKFVLIIHLKG